MDKICHDGGVGNRERTGYLTDVTDEEWAFVAPYLALCREDAHQREYPLRAVFNALRYVAKTGCHWRMLPNDLPPWQVVYQQMLALDGCSLFRDDSRGSTRAAARIRGAQSPAYGDDPR